LSNEAGQKPDKIDVCFKDLIEQKGFRQSE
jgi:hypothetical protein